MNWIAKAVFNGPKGPCYMEAEISAPTVQSALREAERVVPNGFVYSVATKRPKDVPANAVNQKEAA